MLALWRRAAVRCARFNATAAPVPASAAPVPALSGHPDLQHLPQMKSGDLRKLTEAAVSQGGDPVVLEAIAEKCMASAEKLQHWDMIHILQAYTTARASSQPLLLRFSEALSAKTSQLAPKHVLDLFDVYEANDLRPRLLYVELFHAVVRLSRAMYAEELSQTLQALARHGLGSPSVVAHLTRAVRLQLKEFRLCYLCGVTGALGALNACPEPLLRTLDAHAELEVQCAAPQELLDDLRAMPELEFSWRPYEELCLQEFLRRVRAFSTAEEVDQLAQPFEVLRLLQARNQLQEGYLHALCQWCLRGVHRPNVRSERRPTAKQLLALHDRFQEAGLGEPPALRDCLRYYAESGGGVWPSELPQPLRYAKRRKYLRRAVDGDVPDAVAVPEGDGLVTPAPFEDEAPAEVKSAARKLCGPAPELDEKETTVACRIKSRKGPRLLTKSRDRPWRRLTRDLNYPRELRKDWPRAPLHITGGERFRPLYHYKEKVPIGRKMRPSIHRH